jgi:hypothetical protein
MTSISGLDFDSAQTIATGKPPAELDGQRNAWLRQLDISQLALLKVVVQQRQSAAPSRSPDEQRHVKLPQADTSIDRAAPTLLPVHAPLQPATLSNPSDESRSDSNAAQSYVSGSPAVGAAHADLPFGAGAPRSMAEQAANLSAKQGGTAFARAMSAQQETDRAEIAASPIAHATPPPVAMTLASAVVPRVAAATSGVDVGQEAAVASGAARRPSGFLSGLGPAAAPSATSEATMDILEPAESGSAEVGSRDVHFEHDNWQQRQIHVAQTGTDVSVSIRDQALGASQSTRIVYQLISDAAETGLRLRSAVINGKSLFKATHIATNGDGLPGDSVNVVRSLDF